MKLRRIQSAAMAAVAASIPMPFAPGARVLAPCRGDDGEVRWAPATVVSASGHTRRLSLDHLADPEAPAGGWDVAAAVDELHPMGPEPIVGGGSVCGLLVAAGRAMGLSGGQLLEIRSGSRERGVSLARARVVRALKDGAAGAGVTWSEIAAALGCGREGARALYARRGKARV